MAAVPPLCRVAKRTVAGGGGAAGALAADCWVGPLAAGGAGVGRAGLALGAQFARTSAARRAASPGARQRRT
jgi:hypothetical protein